MSRPELSRDGGTLTVRVPFAFRKRGGRKRVVAPDGTAWAAPRPRVDNTMVKALARAHLALLSAKPYRSPPRSLVGQALPVRAFYTLIWWPAIGAERSALCANTWGRSSKRLTIRSAVE